MKWIWVFHGDLSQFSTGVFTSKETAEDWIERSKVSGALTRMPLDISIYDWVVNGNLFVPKYPSQRSPEFIQRFSSAYLEHFHYKDGVCVS